MAKEDRVYGEVDNKTDLKEVYSEIRDDVEKADSRDRLTELYRRAGYLITLTNAASWEDKFGDKIDDIRSTAEEEFRKTARDQRSSRKHRHRGGLRRDMGRLSRDGSRT